MSCVCARVRGSCLLSFFVWGIVLCLVLQHARATPQKHSKNPPWEPPPPKTHPGSGSWILGCSVILPRSSDACTARHPCLEGTVGNGTNGFRDVRPVGEPPGHHEGLPDVLLGRPLLLFDPSARGGSACPHPRRQGQRAEQGTGGGARQGRSNQPMSTHVCTCVSKHVHARARPQMYATELRV